MHYTIGSKLYGCCDGLFGRNHHPIDHSRIEGIGADWCVVRDPFHGDVFCAVETGRDIQQLLRESQLTELEIRRYDPDFYPDWEEQLGYLLEEEKRRSS